MRNKKVQVVVFDENARREFVTGFRKRNLARKKEAAERFENQLKEAKKRIREKVREKYKQILKPNADYIDSLPANETNYELPEHTVQVRELIPDEIAEQNNWIGRNRMRPKRNDDDEEDDNTEKQNWADETEDALPGMPAVTSLREAKKIVNSMASALMQKDIIFKKKNKLEKMKNRRQALRKKKLLKKELKKIKGRKRK